MHACGWVCVIPVSLAHNSIELELKMFRFELVDEWNNEPKCTFMITTIINAWCAVYISYMIYGMMLLHSPTRKGGNRATQFCPHNHQCQCRLAYLCIKHYNTYNTYIATRCNTLLVCWLDDGYIWHLPTTPTTAIKTVNVHTSMCSFKFKWTCPFG